MLGKIRMVQWPVFLHIRSANRTEGGGKTEYPSSNVGQVHSKVTRRNKVKYVPGTVTAQSSADRQDAAGARALQMESIRDVIGTHPQASEVRPTWEQDRSGREIMGGGGVWPPTTTALQMRSSRLLDLKGGRLP